MKEWELCFCFLHIVKVSILCYLIFDIFHFSKNWSCPRVTENHEQKNLSAFSLNARVVLVFSELINNSRTRPKNWRFINNELMFIQKDHIFELTSHFPHCVDFGFLNIGKFGKRVQLRNS